MEFFDKTFFKTIASWAGFVWTGSVVVFTVSTLAAQGLRVVGSVDLMKSDTFGVSLLIIVFLGIMAFGIMALSLLLGRFAKGRDKTKPPFGLTFKRLFLISGVSLFTLFVFVLGSSNEAKRNEERQKESATSGPEIWEAINEKRKEYGTGELELVTDPHCEIASFRLGKLIDLGKLDQHEGLRELVEDKESDVYALNQKARVTEYLLEAPGGSTTQQIIDGWDNTLGHKLLFTDERHEQGCVYANKGFAVVIVSD